LISLLHYFNIVEEKKIDLEKRITDVIWDQTVPLKAI